MSIRGMLASTLAGCLTVLFVHPMAFAEGSQTPSRSEDRPAAAAPGTQPAAQGDETAPVGSVQKALQLLFTVPRPQPRVAMARGATTRPAPSANTDPGASGLAADRTTRGAAKQRVAAMERGAVPEPEVIVGPPGYPAYYYPPQQLPSSEREWSNYRYYGGQPYRYGYGMNDSFGDSASGDIYRFGFTRGYNTGRFDQVGTERQERVLAHAQGHLERGLAHFRTGRYSEAAGAFKLAAESNQGDPASRLYAAHALFATGRYREAVQYLRRAFELQPKVAFLDFDIRDDYDKRADFDSQLAALDKALAQSPRNLDRLITLGYIRYYSGQRDQAYAPLSKAAQIDPGDTFVPRLLKNCHPPDVEFDAQPAERPVGGTTQKPKATVEKR